MLSISDFENHDWTNLGFEENGNLDLCRAESALDALHWRENPRPSTAPTESELKRMLQDRMINLDISARKLAEAAGLHPRTTKRALSDDRQLKYSTLVKLCNVLKVQLTVTPPGEELPARQHPAGYTDPATAPAPTSEELHAIVDTRCRTIKKLLKTNRYRPHGGAFGAARGITFQTGCDFLVGHMTYYNRLRTLLAAIEIDLVVKPPDAPLPECLTLTRFSKNRTLPVQFTKHHAGTDINGEPIKEAPAPADHESPDSFYLVSPDNGTGPANISEGDYCLASRTAKTPDGHLYPAWIRLSDGTGMIGLKLNDKCTSAGGKPPTSLHIVRWEQSKSHLLEFPITNVTDQAPILAVWSGRPEVKRTPKKRNLTNTADRPMTEQLNR